MMAKIVKCPFCGLQFDREKVPFKMVGARRYAHEECFNNAEKNKSQEEKDKEALFEYIKTIFKTNYVSPVVQKQIKQFINEYNYTYSGIHRSLIYLLDIKKNPVEKMNGRLTIVPYIYQEAYNYYYAIWAAKEKNKEKVIKVDTVEIRIKSPERKVRKRKLFSFLDEVENE
jgi:hypothetical protein